MERRVYYHWILYNWLFHMELSVFLFMKCVWLRRNKVWLNCI